MQHFRGRTPCARRRRRTC